MRVAVRYTGRVQGVGFRATAREVAGGFAVAGFVRNEADGGVWLEVQGEGDEVEAFLGRLGAIMGGNIRSAQRFAMTPVPGETGFEIRR